jgi:hypothetical protein
VTEPIKISIQQKWIIALLIVIVILLVVNIFVTLKSFTSRRPKADFNMPVKFAVEHPECANKLLEAMNITNVRIVPADAADSSRYKESVP